MRIFEARVLKKIQDSLESGSLTDLYEKFNIEKHGLEKAMGVSYMIKSLEYLYIACQQTSIWEAELFLKTHRSPISLEGYKTDLKTYIKRIRDFSSKHIDRHRPHCPKNWTIPAPTDTDDPYYRIEYGILLVTGGLRRHRRVVRKAITQLSTQQLALNEPRQTVSIPEINLNLAPSHRRRKQMNQLQPAKTIFIRCYTLFRLILHSCCRRHQAFTDGSRSIPPKLKMQPSMNPTPCLILYAFVHATK